MDHARFAFEKGRQIWIGIQVNQSAERRSSMSSLPCNLKNCFAGQPRTAKSMSESGPYTSLCYGAEHVHLLTARLFEDRHSTGYIALNAVWNVL